MGDIYSSGGVSDYPTALDTFSTQQNANPAIVFDATSDHASKVNNVATAITSIENVLGITGASGFNAGPRVIGNNSLNNSTTPNTQWDLVCDGVVLRNTSPSTTTSAFVYRHNPGTITNNVSTAGPAANGRDQAGVFVASSWIHFYWIWNGTTLASVSSTVAPPTGPTFPTGYTHWAYCGAVRFDGTSAMVKTRIKGAWAMYEAQPTASLSAGSATAETAIDVSAVVPPNALVFQTRILARYQSTTAGENNPLIMRVITTVNHVAVQVTSQVVSQNIENDLGQWFPNVSQQLFYLWNALLGTRSASVFVTGYLVPNGGE